MKKNYILDTNVLLHDPNSLLCFEDNNVLVPIEVIEEIDRFKRESSELGQNARAVSRLLDGFRGAGQLSEGITLPNGGQLRIIFQKPAAPKSGHIVFGTDSVDNRILSLATAVKKKQPKSQTILVSKDINLRIKADALGLLAEDYETDRVLLKDLYTGMIELSVSADKMAAFRANGELGLSGDQRFHPNEFCTLTEETNPKRTVLAKVGASGTKLIPIIDCREGVWGIKPRNREQHFAFDALLDDRVKLVTLMGKAGTGKTLLAMAAGLKRTVVDREFRRLVVARPHGIDGQGTGISARIAGGEAGAVDAADSRRAGVVERFEHGPRAPAERGLDAVGPHRGGSAELYPGPEHRQSVHGDRRGAEPDAAGGQDDHHAGRPRDEGDFHRGSVSDRQSVCGLLFERVQLHREPVPDGSDRGAHRAAKRGTVGTGGVGGKHPVKGGAAFGLGFGRAISYRAAVIGFLRMAGIVNAAVWFGAAVFVSFGLGSATGSEEMKLLLGPKSYPYFSGAIAQIVVRPYFYLQWICGSVALTHLVGTWLYSGKVPARWWRGIILGLVGLSLLSGLWWQPKLKQLHLARHAVNASVERERKALIVHLVLGKVSSVCPTSSVLWGWPCIYVAWLIRRTRLAL